uniref:Major facilitator superfamily (MFS) profile domain-containing protein n=1 Tax=Graphocephala atropunctata TaxID=36148 RepID=A0A1B6LMW9_9HEMI
MCCALLCAFSLPSMDHSLYFHRKTLTLPIECKAPEQLQSKENYSEESSRLNQTRSSYHTNQQPVSAPKSKWNQAIQLLWMDFKDAYTNPYVFKMCVFISLTTCGYNQMMTYVQILWVKIGGKQQEAFNGGVEAIYTMISAVSALAFGQVRGDWAKYGETVIGLLSVLQGAMLLVSSFTDSMIVAYTVYVVFGMLYNIIMVLTNSEVAKHLNQDSYALIFGMNSFAALILQTILTFTVAGVGGLTIPIRSQFMVYGGYFALMGVVYTVKSCFTIWSHYRLDHLFS